MEQGIENDRMSRCLVFCRAASLEVRQDQVVAERGCYLESG